MSTQKMLGELRSGERDLHHYLEELCDLIEANEGHIQALVPGTYKRAAILDQANQLLKTYPEPNQRPPLFGVPFGVKDIFRVDGFPTRCGSQLPESLFAGEEARCVTQLKKAGAIVMAKAVTTEFAFFETGPTRNPNNLDHTPGGSSSGSAAGVAADYFPLALGTQTVGSVIRPAAFCGVVGFKPSAGKIPTEGVIPFSPTADHVGIFCKDVEGIEACMPVLDSHWRHQEAKPESVLGIPDGPFMEQASEEMKVHFEKTATALKEAGFKIKNVSLFEDFETIFNHHFMMTAAEKARVHQEWFSKYKELYRPKTRDLIEQGQQIDDATLQQYQETGRTLRQTVEVSMRAFGVDFWICPASVETAPKGLDSTGSPAMNLPWTSAGLPAISLPSGKNELGLPFGLQIVSGFNQDASLLSFSKTLMQHLPIR